MEGDGEGNRYAAQEIVEVIRNCTYCRTRMSLGEDQRTGRNPLSENSTMLENSHSMPQGGNPSYNSMGSRQWSRTQRKCGTTSTMQQGKRQNSQTGQGEKTPNNLMLEGSPTENLLVHCFTYCYYRPSFWLDDASG